MRFIKCFVFFLVFISCRTYPNEPIEPIEELVCEAESFVGIWKYQSTNNGTVLDSLPDITITLATTDDHILIDSLFHREIHSSFSCQAGKEANVFGGNVLELYSKDVLLEHSRILFALMLTHKYVRE